MTFTNLTALGNHVWQSTLCVVVAWLLTLAMRKNRAAVRYRIWLSASVKFLLPFAPFVRLGEQFVWRTGYMPDLTTMPVVLNGIGPHVVEAAPLMSAVPNVTSSMPFFPGILFGLWLCGVGFGLLVWLRQWSWVRAVKRSAQRLELGVGIPVMSSSARLEPGLFGIFKPVLLLPAGITDHLTCEQLATVVAHELCHVRRRDNLTAAIHMAVETVFWFHPLVWWIRTRLMEERERACDEEVLQSANDPQIYAQGILNVCKLYLESPLACAAGVTGADLKTRIADIMRNRMAYELDWGRRILLIALGTLVVSGPLAVGICAPGSQVVAPSKQAFDVASVKPNKTGAGNSGFRRFKGGQLDATNITLKMLISFAYDVPQNQIVGGPEWIDSERYDILAKPESTSGNSGVALTRQRTQALLADRFKLTLRKDFKILPIFELVAAKGGPKNLRPPAKDGEPDLITNGHHVTCRNASMDFFAKVFLTGQTGRPVVDKTGVDGAFDFAMDWTPDEVPPVRPAGDGNDERAAAPSEFSGPTFYTALRQQLGLKLEAAKGPVQVFVVDRVDRASDN